MTDIKSWESTTVAYDTQSVGLFAPANSITSWLKFRKNLVSVYFILAAWFLQTFCVELLPPTGTVRNPSGCVAA